MLIDYTIYGGDTFLVAKKRKKRRRKEWVFSAPSLQRDSIIFIVLKFGGDFI